MTRKAKSRPTRPVAVAASNAALHSSTSASASPPLQTPSTHSESSPPEPPAAKRKRAGPTTDTMTSSKKTKKAVGTQYEAAVETPFSAAPRVFISLADKLAASSSLFKRNTPTPSKVKQGPFTPLHQKAATSASCGSKPSGARARASPTKPKTASTQRARPSQSTHQDRKGKQKASEEPGIASASASSSSSSSAAAGPSRAVQRERVLLTPPPSSRSRCYSSPLSDLPDEPDEQEEEVALAYENLRRLLMCETEPETDSSDPDVSSDSDESELSAAPEPAHVPTRLPPEITMPSTCLFEYHSSFFLARLVDFHPSPESAGKDRYILRVQGMWGLKSVRREKIVFLHDPKAKSIKRIGGFQRYNGIVPTIESDAKYRATTPPPSPGADPEEAIMTPSEFALLSLREQLDRVRPHLLRIIRNEYPPAQPRIDAFFRSAAHSDYEVGPYKDDIPLFIQPELERWALRGERQGKHGGQPDQPPRPTGNEAYEALSRGRRAKFVFNVLIPEAIRQIEILSHCPSPTSSEEPAPSEQEAYDQAGQRLAKADDEDDWESFRLEAQLAIGQHVRQLDKDELDSQRIQQGTAERGLAGGRVRLKRTYAE